MLCTLLYIQEFDKLLTEQPSFCVYKYNSKGCRISERTIKDLVETAHQHELRHIYFVDIITNRDLSNHIAETLGVIHESPQLIIVEQGKPVHHTSHMHISGSYLTSHRNYYEHKNTAK